MQLDFSNVDRFCNGIDLTQPRPTIDMRNVTFVRPFALIYLGMFLRYHNRRNQYFDVVRPRSGSVDKYLSEQQFWERFNIVLEPGGEYIRRFSSATSFNDIIDLENDQYVAEDIADRVFGLISRQVRVNARRVEECIVELVDNFSQHSEEDLAACAVQWYPNMELLTFAIGDCGIGIRSSLATSERFRGVLQMEHREAAIKALEPGVGRKHEGGMGLSDVLETVRELDGYLFLSTGDGWVRARRNDVRFGTQEYNLSGVQIELSIPTGRRA